MDSIAGIAAALAAMRPDAGTQYEDWLGLSAPRHTPTTSHRSTYAERFLRLMRRRRGPGSGSQPGHTVMSPGTSHTSQGDMNATRDDVAAILRQLASLEEQVATLAAQLRRE